jgi:hypothetical protein
MVTPVPIMGALTFAGGDTIMTTVSVGGELDVLLPDGVGMLADGTGMLVEAGTVLFAGRGISVKMPDPGVELAGTVTLAEAGGIEDEISAPGVTAGAEELENAAGTPVGNTAVLGIGKGKRGASELVPIDTVLIVAFMLGLGVMLGPAGAVTFTDGTILPVGSAAELGMGKGLRGSSVFVPIDTVLIVAFMLGLGVMLGITATVEFADGTGVPPVATIGTNELGVGYAICGTSE